MSEPTEPNGAGFSERGQEPYGDIPTDPDAFLAWASRQPREAGRFELSRGGNVVMQAGTSRYHNMICTNIVTALSRKLDRKIFVISHADFALKMPKSVRYPDIVVDRPGKLDNTMAATNPIFIAEILSPRTMVVDLVEKAGEYREIESLRSYLVCSQDEPRVWVWNRRRDKSWPIDPSGVAGRSRSVKLNGLAIELSLVDIYRLVPIEIRGD